MYWHYCQNNNYFCSNIFVICFICFSCISSIILGQEDDNVIEIDSKTDKQYRGKKYNKLLRCVSIIIGNLITCNNTKNKIIKSYAVSAVSAWLLIGSYDVKLDDISINKLNAIRDTYSSSEPKPSLQNIIAKHYQVNDPSMLSIELELTDRNIEKANKIFADQTNKMDSGIVCS